MYVEIILTEAVGEGEAGMLGVAEVLRNRHWSTAGFAGIRRQDKKHFLQELNQESRRLAGRCLQRARGGSSTVHGATHFENVEAFGMPKWAKGMKRVVKLGSHTFFREP